jgi:hypothetical protein
MKAASSYHNMARSWLKAMDGPALRRGGATGKPVALRSALH